jgi:ParB/RepB/Spo0J family partition protein
MTTVPPSDYNTPITPGNADAAIADAQPGELLWVPPETLVVDPDFNIRIHDRTREQNLNDVTMSMRESGFWAHMPLPVLPVVVDKRHRLMLVGGFTRYTASLRARIAEVPVVLKPAGTTLVDLTAGLVVDNAATPLRPYERAIAAKRLQTYGLSERAIAKKLQLSHSHINNLLYVMSLPLPLQRLISESKVSFNWVVTTTRQHGPSEALEILTSEIALHVPAPGEEDRPLHEDSTEPAAPRTLAAALTAAPAPTIAPAPARPLRAPRRLSPRPVTPRTCLAVIDLTLKRGDLTLLQRWRDGDEATVAEVHASISRVRKQVRL